MSSTNTWRTAIAIVASLMAGAGAYAQTPAEDINLIIDASSGSAVIQNVGSTSLELTGFSITSDSSLLIPGNLSTLAGFVAPASNSASGVAQFSTFNNLSSPFMLPVGDTPIGNLVAANFSSQLQTAQIDAGFGASLDGDFIFDFGTSADQFTSVFGDVIVNNAQANNLILEINTSSGAISLTNDSSLDIQIAALQISSPAEALAAASYTGFGGAGRAAGWDLNPSQQTASGIVELLDPTETASETIVAGETIQLGNAYTQGAEQDAGLSFTVDLVGGASVLPGSLGAFSGEVVFVDGGQAGDFTGDSIVDIRDYVVLRDTSTDVLADHAAFAANFGAGSGAAVTNGSSVPEPGSALIVLPFAALAAIRRFRQ